MSDINDDKSIEQIQLPPPDDRNYFEEQDRKLDILHEELTRLKDENKKQLDTILSSIDQLIADKDRIDKAFAVDSDFVIPEEHKDLSVVDLLAKMTGFNLNDIETPSASGTASEKMDQDAAVLIAESKVEAASTDNMEQDVPAAIERRDEIESLTKDLKECANTEIKSKAVEREPSVEEVNAEDNSNVVEKECNVEKECKFEEAKADEVEKVKEECNTGEVEVLPSDSEIEIIEVVETKVDVKKEIKEEFDVEEVEIVPSDSEIEVIKVIQTETIN